MTPDEKAVEKVVANSLAFPYSTTSTVTTFAMYGVAIAGSTFIHSKVAGLLSALFLLSDLILRHSDSASVTLAGTQKFVEQNWGQIKEVPLVKYCLTARETASQGEAKIHVVNLLALRDLPKDLRGDFLFSAAKTSVRTSIPARVIRTVRARFSKAEPA